MALTNEQVTDTLRTVNDPELHKDLVSLNMVKKVDVSGEDVTILIELTTPACPLQDQIHREVEEAIRAKAAELAQTRFQIRSPVRSAFPKTSLLFARHIGFQRRKWE